MTSSDMDPKELTLTSDTKVVMDMKDHYLLLFASDWNIDWALKHNPGLELAEFSRG